MMDITGKSDLMSLYVFTNTSIISVFNSFYRLHDPKLRNMAHALSLSVFIAFKGTNFCLFTL